MDRWKPQPTPRDTDPGREPISIGFFFQEEEEERLMCEELEPRLAPGGTCYCKPKKTAGWGC
jgi:hypothetical protein